MGLKDFFSRHFPSDGDSGGTDRSSATQPPRGDEPGATSTQYSDGQGTVGLADREGPGAPDTNQGKAEPMPPGPGHDGPQAGSGPGRPAPPELADMSVGGADPQSPSHPAGRLRESPLAGADLTTGPVEPGVPPQEDLPEVGSPSTGSSGGPVGPAQQTYGEARRAPGSLGQVAPGEQVETDMRLSAERTGPGFPPAAEPAPTSELPGDGQGVPVTSDVPLAGTSEDQPVVSGVRSPVEDEPPT